MSSSSQPPYDDSPLSSDSPRPSNLSRDELLTRLYRHSLREFLIAVVAGVTVAAVTGLAGFLYGQVHQQKQIEEAPRVYVEELSRLIDKAVTEGENSAIVNARAIVAARNSLARSLTSISNELDTEIDHLAIQIGAETLQPSSRIPFGGGSDTGSAATRPQDPKAAYQTILVLSKVWPSKKRQIEVEIRKLLAELGILGGPMSATR
jgi:hypothetical protein